MTLRARIPRYKLILTGQCASVKIEAIITERVTVRLAARRLGTVLAWFHSAAARCERVELACVCDLSEPLGLR